MKLCLIILLSYINYVVCGDIRIYNTYPKKVIPYGKIRIINNEKYLKKIPMRDMGSKKLGYTVFPPLRNDMRLNIPDSPYFTIEQNINPKPRVKKVLPDYEHLSLRNKRSPNSKGEQEDDIHVKKSQRTKTIVKRHADKLNAKINDRLKAQEKKLSKNQSKRAQKNLRSANTKKKVKSLLPKAKKIPVKLIANNKKRSQLKYTKKINSRILRATLRRGKKGKRGLGRNNRQIRKATRTSRRSQRQRKVIPNRRLIAARDATIEDYPYVVSIQKDGQHWCAGALLNPRLVITTANCIWKANRVSRLRIRAGSRYADRGGQEAKVQEAMKHPGWGIRRNPDNDVALILLDRNIKFSHSVHGVDLPNSVMMPAFEDAWITSWGSIRRDGVFDNRDTSLQVYHARLLDRVKCNNVTQRFGVIVNENFICLAQTGRRAPCTRDTGAPAVSDGVLWGLASWGIRKLCGTERFPAMFSYLASRSNLDFITNATHYLMSDERHYPFIDRFPNLRAVTTTTVVPDV